ncbi:MAG: hypothetical protein R3C17_13245 [Planctomycetaceae bacterium]
MAGGAVEYFSGGGVWWSRCLVYLDAYEHAGQKPEGPESTWNGFEVIVPHRRIVFVFTTKNVKVRRL